MTKPILVTLVTLFTLLPILTSGTSSYATTIQTKLALPLPLADDETFAYATMGSVGHEMLSQDQFPSGYPETVLAQWREEGRVGDRVIYLPDSGLCVRQTATQSVAPSTTIKFNYAYSAYAPHDPLAIEANFLFSRSDVDDVHAVRGFAGPISPTSFMGMWHQPSTGGNSLRYSKFTYTPGTPPAPGSWARTQTELDPFSGDPYEHWPIAVYVEPDRILMCWGDTEFRCSIFDPSADPPTDLGGVSNAPSTITLRGGNVETSLTSGNILIATVEDDGDGFGVFVCLATKSPGPSFVFGPLTRINEDITGNSNLLTASSLAPLASGGWAISYVVPTHPDDNGNGGLVLRFLADDTGHPLTDAILVPPPQLVDTSFIESFPVLATLASSDYAVYVSYVYPDAVEEKAYIAAMGMVPEMFDPSSSSNPVVRLSPLRRARAAFTLPIGAFASSGAARVASPAFASAPSYSQIDVFRFPSAHLDSAVGGMLHDVWVWEEIVLDSSLCSSLGQTPFTLDCLGSLLLAGSSTSPTKVPPIGHGFRVRLPAGTWTGCPPQGLPLNMTLTLLGAGPDATIIDCQGTGRAFTFDGSSLVWPNAAVGTHLVMANMTISNGAVVHTQGDGDAPFGGGCLLLENTIGTGVWISLENMVFADCSVASSITDFEPAPLGSAQGSVSGTFLVGGAVAAIDVPDLWVSAVRVTGSSLSIPGLPVTTTGNPKLPQLYGGGLGVAFSALASTSYFGVEPDTSARGFSVIDSQFDGNTVSVSTPLARGGGGGLAVAHIPARVRGLALARISCQANVVTGALLSGGGLLLNSFAYDSGQDTTWVGNLTLVNNVASGSARGGGLSLRDVTDTFGAPFRVHHSTISGNTAQSSGGAGVFVERENTVTMSVLMSTTEVANNVALSSNADGGGMLVIQASVVLSTGARVWANSAGGSGGGLLVTGSDAELTLGQGSVVEGNSATLNGGGISFSGAVLFYQSSLNNNYAAGSGGGLHGSAGTVFFLPGAQAVTGNSAGGSGGGVFECLFSTSCGRALAQGCNSLAGFSPATTTMLDYSPILALPAYANASASDVEAVLVAGNSAPIAPEAGSDPVVLDLVSSHYTLGSILSIRSSKSPLQGAVVVAKDTRGQVPALEWQAELGAMLWGDDGTAERLGLSNSELGTPDELLTSDETCTSPGQDAPCDLSPFLLGVREAEGADSVFRFELRLVDAPCVAVSEPIVFRVLGCGENELGVVSTILECQVVCGEGQKLTAPSTPGGDESCTPCPAGTSQFLDQHRADSCNECSAGEYAFEGRGFCSLCPPGGDCGPDGTFLRPLPGYWYPEGNVSLAVDIPVFVGCTPPEACPGGDIFRACAKGYDERSFACSRCSDGYAKINDTCYTCGPAWFSFAVVAVVVFAVVGVVVQTIRSATSTGGSAKFRSQLLKVAINTAQTLSLLVALSAQTSDLLASYVGGATSVASFSLSMFPAACAVETNVYQRLLFTMCLPPVAALGLVAGYVGYALVRRGEVLDAVVRAMRALAVVLFLAYPSLMAESFGMFRCRTTSVRPGSWLVADLDKECYVGEHVGYATLAGVGIGVYVVLMPLAFAGYLVMARARKGQLWLAERFSFFVFGYEPRYWAWEGVILLRKVALAALVVFADRTMEQLLFATVVLISIGFAHAYVSPFVLRTIDVLELVGIAVSVIAMASFSVTLTSSRVATDNESSGQKLQARSGLVFVLEWAVVVMVFFYFLSIAVIAVFNIGSPTSHTRSTPRVFGRKKNRVGATFTTGFYSSEEDGDEDGDGVELGRVDDDDEEEEVVVRRMGIGGEDYSSSSLSSSRGFSVSRSSKR